MARTFTHLTLSSLTLALSLTGCGGRDLTLGTRDDGVNLDDEGDMTPDADGVGDMGTGTGSGGSEPSGVQAGTMDPADAEDQGSGTGTGSTEPSSGGGAPAMGMGTPVAGAGPCTELRGGEIAYLNADGEVEARSPDSGVTVDGDGTTTIYHRDGTRTVIQPDGTQTTTPDAMITTAEDGTQTLYFSDGTVVTLLADESVVAVGVTWSVEGGPNGSTGTGFGPVEVPCSGTSGGGTMDPATGMVVDPAPEDAFLRMCTANGDGTYSYVEADGTTVTVSRPESEPDGTISMEEASSPCAAVWAAEDADETGDGSMGSGGAPSGDTVSGGSTGEPMME
jgi:hypothetical protein